MEKMKVDSSSFENLKRAFDNLQLSISTPIREPRDLSGIIKDFEMVYELSWKVMKKVLQSQGVQTTGPKDVFSKAYQLNLIEDENIWLEMIESRNQAAHVYDKKSAEKIVSRVKNIYIDLFPKYFDL